MIDAGKVEKFFSKKEGCKNFPNQKIKIFYTFPLGGLLFYFQKKWRDFFFYEKKTLGNITSFVERDSAPALCIHTHLLPPFSIVVFSGNLKKSNSLSLLVFLTLNHFAGETFFLLLFGIERIFLKRPTQSDIFQVKNVCAEETAVE